jgi:nucleotide-binding universal stress UspA family protein
MFRSILVPLDGSQESATAVPLALTVARTTGGHLHLLTVTPDSGTVESAALVHLQGTAAMVCDAHVSVHTSARIGDAATEILAYATQHANDMIVMATRAVGPRSVMALTSVPQ